MLVLNTCPIALRSACRQRFADAPLLAQSCVPGKETTSQIQFVSLRVQLDEIRCQIYLRIFEYTCILKFLIKKTKKTMERWNDGTMELGYNATMVLCYLATILFCKHVLYHYKIRLQYYYKPMQQYSYPTMPCCYYNTITDHQQIYIIL